VVGSHPRFSSFCHPRMRSNEPRRIRPDETPDRTRLYATSPNGSHESGLGSTGPRVQVPPARLNSAALIAWASCLHRPGKFTVFVCDVRSRYVLTCPVGLDVSTCFSITLCSTTGHVARLDQNVLDTPELIRIATQSDDVRVGHPGMFAQGEP
jgi:hypothetical protein